MTVVPATRDDVAAIVALEEVCQGADAWSEALVRDGVTGGVPTVHHLVVREGDVVGYAVASAVGDVVELQRIGVDPEQRRGGLATRLLEGVLDLARSEGAERVLLEVREDNAGALAFYASRGFTELARRPHYYRGGAAAVVLELPVTGPDVKVWTTS
ncbi:MAG: GNAT family N-acetyltransferase [Nocardioides sp.]